jgi:LPS export ABC transporter protein LptC
VAGGPDHHGAYKLWGVSGYRERALLGRREYDPGVRSGSRTPGDPTARMPTADVDCSRGGSRGHCNRRVPLAREITKRGGGWPLCLWGRSRSVGGRRLDQGDPLSIFVPVCYSMTSMRWILLLLAAVMAAALPQTVRAAAPGGEGESSPEMTLQQVHILETRGGVRVWEVRADRVEVREREGVTLLSRVQRPIEITFYSAQGQLACQANRASLDLKTKDVWLEGSVLARSEQGMELKTESLRWLAASRRLVSDQAVTINRGSLVTQGKGMEAETDLERVRIFQNITSHVGPMPNGAGRSRVP